VRRFLTICLVNWKTVIWVSLVLGLGNVITAVSLHFIRDIYTEGFTLKAGFNLQFKDFVNLGTVPIFLVSLILEANILGWESSSMRKLFDAPSASSKTDLFYLLLKVSNLELFASALFTLGLGYTLEIYLRSKLGMSLMHDSDLWKQGAVQLLIGSFVFYWAHRLHHTRFFWEYHKLHHAATEMNLANNFRSHPAIYYLRSLMEVVPGAILGINPMVILAYSAFMGTLVIWQHSDVNWNLPWLERYLFIGSGGHRLHHSSLEKHYKKNIGYLVLWDWMFGTLMHPDASLRVPIGIKDPLHNSGKPLREMLQVFHAGNLALLREIGKRPASFRLIKFRAYENPKQANKEKEAA